MRRRRVRDEVWKAAYEEAEKVAKDSKARIAQRCRELNIPEKFAPNLNLGWHGQGMNASKELRAEMRREGKARIVAMEAVAKTEIERISVESQAELISDGLTSEAAKAFFEQLPSAESLMPLLELNQVRGLLEHNDR